MPLTITLDGLICHVGPDATHKKMAVVVDHAGHKPKLFVAKRFRITDPSKDLDVDLKRGDVVKFASVDGDSDLPPGPATTKEPEFGKFVPGLERLLEDGDSTKNKIDPDTEAEKEDQKGSVVYVKYPGGKLRPVTVLKKKLKFTKKKGDPIKTCVADLSELVSTNTKNVILTVKRRKAGGDITETITKDAVVAITNELKGNHFHAYRHLTLAGAMAKAETIDEDCTDEGFESRAPSRAWKKRGETESVEAKKGGPDDPECSNSQWP